ncbi:MAG: hypothetical protein ACRDQI_12955 [Pseudonocardiaceae bacterium]
MTTSTDITTCTIDVSPVFLTLTADLSTKVFNVTDPDEPVGFVHEDQDLKVQVTVTLNGTLVNYLCDTELCVCLAFESCGSGPEGEFCQNITLEGDYDPCNTHCFVFEFDLPGGTLIAGPCGKQYDICITLGSRDCCGIPGFVFGSCKDFHISVLPAVKDHPDN